MTIRTRGLRQIGENTGNYGRKGCAALGSLHCRSHLHNLNLHNINVVYTFENHP